MTARAKILIAAIALVVIAGGAGLGIFMSRSGVVARIDGDAAKVEQDADTASDDLVRQEQPIYYAFDPPLLVNIKDTDAVLQASVSVSTHYASVADAVKNDDPALRSAILLALSDAREDLAMTDTGKQQLLARTLAAVNAQLRQDGFKGSVDAAYFTDFIIQSGSGGQ